MSDKIVGNKLLDLYNADDMVLECPFLKSGYIINLDNEPLHNETIHGLKPKRWHVYEIVDHKIISLASLSDKEFERLKNFLSTKPWESKKTERIE